MKNLNKFSLLLFVVLMPLFVVSQHFQPVWESPFNPMNIYITSATLNDAGLQAGGEIGVFDVFQDEAYCVGAVVLTEAILPGEYAQIICSMDDNSYPDQKTGFQPGSPFIFKYWANNVEFVDVVFSFPFPGYDETFNALGTALVDLSLEAEFQSQTINLTPGWNAMSSYLNPLNPVMQDLLSEITDELVIVQNPDGSYYPSGNINDLETWNYESGYFIKLTDSVSLNIIGDEPANPKVMLESGWNLVPVLSDTSILLTDLFGESIDKVVVIKDAIGLNLFWPGKDIATLEELSPGKSYLLKVSEGFELSFSGNPVFNCGDILLDERDGQEYATVQLGDQCWMAENFNVGNRIDGSEDMTDNGIIEKYCYNNSISNCDTYGGLYQWDEAMQYISTEGTQGICMEGWHLATVEEWTLLEEFVMSQPEFPCGYYTSHIGKSLASKTHWFHDSQECRVGNDLTLNNATGFSALPGGYQISSGNTFRDANLGGNWHTSSQTDDASEIWYMALYYDARYAYTWKHSISTKSGKSVRCLRD